MHSAVMDMLARYNCVTKDDYREALKEIIQEIALLGLYRAGFFNHAAFYGGTALRIFYGLDRFSEDLDFSLEKVTAGFELATYLPALNDELGAYGFDVEVSKKEKQINPQIESAFIKAGTRIHLLKIGFKEGLLPPTAPSEKLKVKLEIDVGPPNGAEFEVKYHLRPIPYYVRLLKPSYLFAGKVHALLCRKWNSKRVKGRDLYDYLWFVAREIPLNLSYLNQLMIQSGHLPEAAMLDHRQILKLLQAKFNIIDYNQARKETSPFIKEAQKLDLWSEDFFSAITKEKLISV